MTKLFFGPVSDSSDGSETELAPLSCPDEVRSDEEENLEDLDNGVTRVQTGNPVTLQEKRTQRGGSRTHDSGGCCV